MSQMEQPREYRRYSYWLESCGDDLTPRPGLDGSIEADVAILGAGFTGLWTAYYLKRARPELAIAVVEREIAGFGASGRNGGFVTPGLQVSLGKLAARFGRDRARAQQLAMFATVDEVGRVVAEEEIDCGYHKGGYLRVARGPQQLPALESSARAAEAFGLADHYQRLDAQETKERVQIAGALGATFNPQCALVQPAKLVRGLARAVERLGVTIYEGTPVTDFVAGPRPRLLTPRGEVRGGTLVLAGESYLTRLPQLNRQLIPVYSLITLTEPLSQADWEEIGWEGRECLSSPRLTVDYLSKTPDGRIAFGGRGAPYHYGSTIADEYDRHEPTHAALRQATVEWFPRLKNVAFTHAWGGPLGMPRDWLPTMSYDRASGIASSRGYTGQGVATANLAGRVLTDLILERQSPLTELPLVNHQSPDWEPEPWRWLGVRYVQRGYQRLDEQSERSGRAPNGRTLVERLGSH
ncbi:MAG TPA: FAD-dependent oxidoreductase [Thermomicrobiaceae bacterium]|nr:FAD-dependent oxidoreductase [Thermomicrobiaceae bacterium]